MSKFKILALVILIVMVFSLVTACSPSDDTPDPIDSEPGEDPEIIELLRVGLGTDESTLNPYTYVTGSPGLDLVNLIYDTLFQLDNNNIPQPWLVKEYEVSDDYLVYTFAIHEGIEWHDGTPFTAEDVKFTYEYLLTYPKSRFTNPVRNINKIEVTGEHNIVMTLENPDPVFLVEPIADLPILPKQLWEVEDNPDEADIRIGTGPYILEELVLDQYYRFKANENYFNGTPIAETLVFPVITDSTALFTALKAGDLDAVTRQLTPEIIDEFRRIPNLAFAEGAGYTTRLLQFNNERHPFTVKEFREALSLAVDKEDIINTVLLGQAIVGSPGFIHPDSPYFNSSIELIPDSGRVTALLDEIGFVDSNGSGFREDAEGKEIKLDFLVYANDPILLRTAELITQNFVDVGIDVSVKAMDRQTVDALVWPDFDVTKGRDFDMSMWGWTAPSQLFPARLTSLFYSDLTQANINIGAFASEDFDRLSDQLKITLDEDARKDIIKEMQSVIAAEYPLVPLYYQNIVNAYYETVYDGWQFRNGQGIINKLSFIK